MAIPGSSALFIVALALTVFPPTASAQPFRALVAPISKDSPTSLYSITLNTNEKYVIDLGSPFPWRHCRKGDPHAACTAPLCTSARRYIVSGCTNNSSSGKQTPDRCSRCLVTTVNPISKSCAWSVLSHHDVILPWTDGHSPTVRININRVGFACAPRPFFLSLPKGSSGVASLSRAPLSLPMQFRSVVKTQFAICLPGYSAPGVIFFGSGPYYLLPPPGRNITQFLSFTPLLKNPIIPTNGDYYVQVKGITINGRSVEFLGRMLEFDSLGHGGVKLSMTVPYTTLRSNIYRPFLKLFSWSTRGIPRAPKVKPFGLCLNTTHLGSTRVGLPVPQIDLVLGNGRNWTIFGANSMKQVSDGVACLAFVDGGEKAEQAALIGSHQIDDNFLLFDLIGNRLGFSSSLLFFQTTCSNFNFTSGN